MNKQGNVYGRLNALMRWPLFILPFLLAVVLAVCVFQTSAPWVVMAFTCLYLLFTLWWILYWRKHITQEIVTFAGNFAEVQKRQLEDLPLPYALLQPNGSFLWMNHAFQEITFEDSRYQRHVCNLFPELQDKLPADGKECHEIIHFEGVSYRAEMQSLDHENQLVSICLFDVTDHLAALEEIEAQRAVTGLIYIDNYEEVMKSTETVRQSLLAALIERKITKYFDNYEAVVRRLDKDKFSLLLKKKDLDQIEGDRFSILEDVKTLSIGNEIAVTLSISVGMDGDSFADNSDYARMGMDLALARGGDQAIIRNPEGSKFYGGKSRQQERQTRVKARVKAQALRELLATKDQILIMGHKMSDIDSFGAGIGIFRAARTLEKQAHIVIDDVTSSVRPLMQCFLNNPEYPEDLCITGAKALELLDENTTVVVVDVNKPSYTECPSLLEHASSIVVLDHHRQGSEVIERATLSYIEPYASSACEMVAEILQYFADNLKLRPLEAEAIYAGIVIDTNNFMNKTGVRTFEAAAFLRRCGADMARVRKLFREKMEDYQAKAETVRTIELFEESFAFGVCPSDGIESPMIVGAQAANELLDIIGVKASIIFTKYKDEIYISARSIDEVNVQIIMERLGGGGHLSTAGTQLKGCTLEEAKELVKETIRQMMEEGAI